MAIDYEKEYDNRARVPEHPQIFARWQRQAAAYREAARDAELGLAYGPSARQTVDLFPAKNRKLDDDNATPLALFIHGGWWRSLEPSMFSQVAAGPNARGISVAVAGYDLCPQVSVAAIIGQMRDACLWLWRRKRRRIMVYGYSAGGHLAACMLAQDWPAFASDAPADLVPSVYAISGVYDLTPVLKISVNEDLRLDDAQARAVSPLHGRAPRGRTLDAVVGTLESAEFRRQSRVIVDAWSGNSQTRYEEIAGVNHFTIVDALADPASAMTARVSDLAFAANTVAG
jgi:arylformamidase